MPCPRDFNATSSSLSTFFTLSRIDSSLWDIRIVPQEGSVRAIDTATLNGVYSYEGN